MFRQDLNHIDFDTNDDYVQQARRKVEAPQGKSLLYLLFVPIRDFDVVQAPKKAKAEDDEETKAFKDKQKADAAALAAAKDRGEHRRFSCLR